MAKRKVENKKSYEESKKELEVLNDKETDYSHEFIDVSDSHEKQELGSMINEDKKNKNKVLAVAVAATFLIGGPVGLAACMESSTQEEDEEDDSYYGGSGSSHRAFWHSSSSSSSSSSKSNIKSSSSGKSSSYSAAKGGSSSS